MSMGDFGVEVEDTKLFEYETDKQGRLDRVINTHCFQITPWVPHVIGSQHPEPGVWPLPR